MGVITFSVFRASRNGFFDRDRETYEYNGATFTVYMDELPLTVEDMFDIQYAGLGVHNHGGETSDDL